MPVRLNLSLYQANPEKALLTITKEDDNTAQDLTGASIEVYVKPTRDTADDDPDVTLLSTGSGEVVITGLATAGMATVTFPNDLPAITQWWRADVIVSGQRKTCAFGSLTVENT